MVAKCAVWFCLILMIAVCKGGRRNGVRSRMKAKNWTQNLTNLTARCDRRPVIMTRTHGILRSPGYPRAYGNNQRCTWHISAPRGFKIRLKFRRHFQIQTSSSCAKDYLMLAQSRHFRSPLIYCGRNRPTGILTPRNNLWVRFQSDGSGSAKGFFASYMAVDENECEKPVCTFPSLCRNTVGSFACDCPDGYDNRGRRDATKCTDTDECKTGTARCDHRCVNTDGSYYCLCRKGYRLAPDGKKCRADKDECLKGNSGCSHFCRNTKSSFRCYCPKGYTLHSDKKSCFPEITFNSQQYLATIDESSPKGSEVTTVVAKSFIKSKPVYYQLLSENLKKPTKFVIQRYSGKVLVNGALDREETADYLLEVSAGLQHGNGSMQSVSKAFLIVNVLDENDNAPVFSQPSFHLKVPCNASVGKILYRVHATDRDAGENARIKFKFMSKISYFSILPNTGKIRLLRSLKRFCNSSRSQKKFSLSIVARDQGVVPNVAHALMQVEVLPPGVQSSVSVMQARFLDPVKPVTHLDTVTRRKVRHPQSSRTPREK